MARRKLISLAQEGIGKFRHFITLDGRMLLGDKVGETVLRRENLLTPINFCDGAPTNAQGFNIARIEKTKEGVYFYTIEFYANLRKYDANQIGR